MGISEKLLKNAVERRLLEVIFNKIRECVDAAIAFPIRGWVSRHNRVIDNKIVFMTYNNQYMCNPKYICEEILKQKLPLDIVWITSKKLMNSDEFPEGIRLVERNSYECFKEVTSAKVWVENAISFHWDGMKKKKNQYFIQTWHGSMGLKRIGKGDVKDKHWLRVAIKSSKQTDVCISNSEFETQVFRDSYWPNTEIKKLGHARNDILFADEARKQDVINSVREFFDIPNNKKIALYAPTFRDALSASKYYTMDYTRLLDALEACFGGEWVLLNRFHFKAKTQGMKKYLDSRIIPATEYPDIQDLMLAADIGITDYSSWICDFVLTDKPGFIYAPDLNEYDGERGFYYPLSSTPFPIAQNNNEMEHNIRQFNYDIYMKKRAEFLEARGCVENGTAAVQIVEIIKEKCLLNSESYKV